MVTQALAMALLSFPDQPDLQNPGANQVIWVTSPNFGPRPADAKIDTIVLHHTAGTSLQSTVKFFEDPASQVSAHFVVGKDGSIVQMVSRFDRAWHAGASIDAWGRPNVNDFSIGIEIDNLGDSKDPYPEPQLYALDLLIRTLIAWHPIKQITSHEYIAEPQGRKIDPSPNFPWNRYAKYGIPLFFGRKPTKPGLPE